MPMYCFIISKAESTDAYWRPEDLPDRVPREGLARAIKSPGQQVNLWGGTTISYVPIAGQPPPEYLAR